ncbi:MAG TPA: hypothetical protein VNN80_11765, partial [Polyangiaceae bacterium]|nr:hypothetical protein [Polyangiaceae bacterium]
MDQLPPLLAPEPPRGPEPTPGPAKLGHIRSACAIALHMHQPLIPAGGPELTRARIISNLEYMRERGSDSERHDARMFHECYRRMSEIVRTSIDAGQAPRVMLEYSGTLLHGLAQMGLTDVFDELRRVTEAGAYRHAVEWLGAPWGHAVAPSTPVLDYRRHVLAWRAHFADLFGAEALAQVRGFSPSEMALPNHPDHAYELVRALRDAGYEWMLVQEHSVELGGSGGRPTQVHLPHRLVCNSSRGESASIIAIIKTGGSDSKLVGQMQPFYEARSRKRVLLAGVNVPELVTQIADGENGGVMMNEFPSKYREVVGLASGSDTPLLNVSEYLDELYALGVRPEHLPELWPATTARVWQRIQPGDGPERLAQVIAELSAEDPRFHLEGGSWTNDISWVRGYGDLLNDMERVSALFYEKVDRAGVSPHEPRVQNALFHLLCSQTSCYRYWGEGRWTDYGRELCRRTREILTHDF